MHNKNAFLTTNLEKLSEKNDALKKDLETARWQSERLRDSEVALAQRLKCQRHALQQIQWQLQDSTDFERGLKKLEATPNTVEKDIADLIAQRELGLAAERELEQQLMMEREEHYAAKREYKRGRRKERARNSALVKRVKALELLEVEMKEEMEGNWLYWI